MDDAGFALPVQGYRGSLFRALQVVCWPYGSHINHLQMQTISKVTGSNPNVAIDQASASSL